jgi:pimeloyl-ACP methyl ester carboxylesterase
MSPLAPLPTPTLTGNGPVVAFLNGGMMTHAGWRPVASALEGAYQGVFFDFRGQLATPGRSHRDLAGHVDDVVAILERASVRRAHLIGTSFGAAVGILLAARYAERVRSLIAVTTADVAAGRLGDRLRELGATVRSALRDGSRDAYAELLSETVYSARHHRDHAEEMAGLRERVAALPEPWFEALLDILHSLEQLDLRSELGRVRCPTLVVHAGRDALIAAERSRALAEGIAGAELVEHPDSGHALVAEDPAWLGTLCRAFLDRVEAGRGSS